MFGQVISYLFYVYDVNQHERTCFNYGIQGVMNKEKKRDMYMPYILSERT